MNKVAKLTDYKTSFYPESKLTGYTYLDGTIAFYNNIHTLLGAIGKARSVVLDIGCGRGFYAHEIHDMADRYRWELRNFKGKVAKVIGMDVDKNAAVNPTLDEFHLIKPDQEWPLPSASVDLIICDFVVEHVADAQLFFNEAKRVLKPKGWICIRTTNKNGYVGILSRLIPNRLHAKVLSKVQENRLEEDVFPTTYECNTKRQLERQFKAVGLEGYVLPYEGEPTYLSFSKVAYFFGVVFQKIAPKSLRNTLFAFGQKQA